MNPSPELVLSLVLLGAIAVNATDVATQSTEWMALNPATTPAVRRHAPITFDVARGRVVYFGGLINGSSWAHDTWEFDGVDWSRRFPVVSPSASTGILAYDPVRQVSVMFGGGSFIGALDDTWEWTGFDWREVVTQLRPQRRWGASMTWDAARDRAMLVGGFDSFTSVDAEWVFVTQDMPAFEPFGNSCMGSNGMPLLTSHQSGPARIGGTFELSLENLPLDPLALPFGMLGGSCTANGTMPLPIPLGHWGMPGCWLHIRNDAAVALENRRSTASRLLAIPLDPALVDLQVFVQGAVFDPTATALGVVTTNGGSIVIAGT